MERPTEDQDPSTQPAPEATAAEEPPAVDPAAELERAQGAYLRLAADFENFKRRKQQEVEELARYGASGLLTALLPALDNLTRALAHVPEDSEDGLASGLRLTRRQFEEALRSQGVEQIPAVGEQFDPRLHEAVATVPQEGTAAGTVVAEYRPGYRILDRVVRPAQVAVASGETLADGEEPAAPGDGD